MKTEFALIFIFLTGVAMKLLHFPASHEIIILSLSSLMVIYFGLGFYFFTDSKSKGKLTIFSKVTGTFISFVPMGILFQTMHWPMAHIFLPFGVIATIVVLVLSTFYKSKSSEEFVSYYTRMQIRTSALILIAILVIVKGYVTDKLFAN